MSFEIEFNGSLNDRRNLNEVTAASSLVKSSSSLVQRLSTDHEMNFPFGAPSTYGLNWQQLPSSPIQFSKYSAVTAYTNSGSFFDGGGEFYVAYVDSGQAGASEFTMFVIGDNELASIPIGATCRLQSEVRVSTSTSAAIYQETSSGSTQELWFASGSTVGFFPQDITFVNNGGSISFFMGGTNDMRVNYVRVAEVVSSNVVVNITPQTITDGVPATGGIGVTPLITEINQGQPQAATSATRVKALVKNGSQEIAEASHQPVATDSDLTSNSFLSAKDKTIITATDATLTVEAVDVNQNNFLDIETAIIVDDVSKQASN